MKNEILDHFTATVVPDKTLCAKKIRKLFINQYQTIDKNGENHVHEKRTRKVFPNTVYMDEIGNTKMFFVLTSDGDVNVKTPMPVFCLKLSFEQKRSIIENALKQGLKMTISDFEKIPIAITGEERLDLTC